MITRLLDKNKGQCLVFQADGIGEVSKTTRMTTRDWLYKTSQSPVITMLKYPHLQQKNIFKPCY